ncbi:cyclase family protein [Streptomyces sp. NPDC058486]|uniref:cyclase family protein n=1 Tax=unclassified Streptomyces TaxID=2593676 RepID=UPI00365538D6
MRIIDLSSPVDAGSFEPDPVVHEVMTPREGALHMRDEMRAHFGLEFDPDDLPDGEFLSLDRLSLTTHTGTHVDAPSHYGSRTTYGTGVPRHIDAMPLEWFLGPGVVLDVRGREAGVVDAADLRKELDRIGHDLAEGDIVLLHTGADAWAGTERYFTDFVGLDAGAIAFLLDAGVKVVGTDAFSLDAPFGTIIDTYRRTGDKAVLWPAHVAGRHREYCQVERLAGLDRLPAPTGFRISCFPVKVAGAGAGWARAVALVDDAP